MKHEEAWWRRPSQNIALPAPLEKPGQRLPENKGRSRSRETEGWRVLGEEWVPSVVASRVLVPQWLAAMESRPLAVEAAQSTEKLATGAIPPDQLLEYEGGEMGRVLPDKGASVADVMLPRSHRSLQRFHYKGSSAGFLYGYFPKGG